MKKVLFLLMIILVGQVYGQQSTSQVPIANKWTTLYDCFSSYGKPTWVEETYTLGADTTIGGKTYQRLLEKGTRYYGAIRYTEDMSQLYYRSHSGEYLLCDFSLNVGDQCALYLNDSPEINEELFLQERLGSFMPIWTVDSKEMIDNRWHMTLSTTVTEHFMGEPLYISTISMKMIQGIGSENIVFLTCNASSLAGAMGSAPRSSLCAFQDDETLYSFDLSESGIINNCPDWEYVPSALESAPAEPSARLILRDGHILVEREDELFNLTGQRVE